MKDYYNILGLTEDASQSEIKKAYRKLAHEYHPDKGGDEKKFKEINEAYQVLGNKQKRAQYDKYGQAFGDGAQSAGGFDFSQFGGFESAFEDLGDIFGDVFGFGSGRARSREDLNQGQDIRIKLGIELEDVMQGIEKDIALKKYVICSRCDGSGTEPGTKLKECFSCRGTGTVQQMKRTLFGTVSRRIECPECGGEGKIPEDPCNVCSGEGRVKGEEEIHISIPPGVDTGQTLQVRGAGNAGKRQGLPGDLYAQILVKPHPRFERNGDDLFTTKSIRFSDAVLGSKEDVKLLNGKTIKLKVPVGAQSGKVLKISNKGLPHFTGFGKGNLYVQLHIKTPQRPTKEQKQLLQQLRATGI